MPHTSGEELRGVDMKLEVVVVPVSDVDAREQGRTPEKAAKDAALHMEGPH